MTFERRCLDAVGLVEWRGDGNWRWSADEAATCGLAHVSTSTARALLRGRSIMLVGDSTSRRHMWALVDIAAGNHTIRRQAGSAVPDSTSKFDAVAVGLNDSIFDTRRAYHASQTVLLDTDSGRWEMLDPFQLCGIARTHWEVDAEHVVEAARKGRLNPRRMRGMRVELHLALQARPSSSGQALPLATRSQKRVQNYTSAAVLASSTLKDVSEALLLDWGCRRNCGVHKRTAPQAKEQRLCASNLRVRLVESATGHGEWLVSMGVRGGFCEAAARRLESRLQLVLGCDTSSRPERRGAEHPHAAPQDFNTSFTLAQVRRVLHASSARGFNRLRAGACMHGGARLVFRCEAFCRTTHALYCENGTSLGAAIGAHAARFLGGEPLAGREQHTLSYPALAILTFVYQPTLRAAEDTLRDALTSPRAIGTPISDVSGTQRVILLGATHAAVAISGTESLSRLNGTNALAWTRVLEACGAASDVCILRGAHEQLHQREREPYERYVVAARHLAAQSGVEFVDQFHGTWGGRHVLQHHDRTRIHYSDRGRLFLAQLTLNALRLIGTERRGVRFQ